MLSTLKIENIAIIESAEIDFEPGLNVMSGETGAGKSIIIDALSAVLGERTSKELIRTGAERAEVVAVFDNGVEQTIVSRIICLDGRNICKINGEPATVGMLKTLGKELISIHGQHDSQNLLNAEHHYKYLDSLGGLEELYSEYLEKYTKYIELYRQFKALNTNEEEKQKRIEFLQFEINEIEEADIKIGEYDELCEKRSLFRNAEKVTTALKNAYKMMADSDEETGAVTALFDVAKSFESASQYYDSAKTMASEIFELAYSLSDKKNEIEAAIFDLQFNPDDLQVIEERINCLFKLKGKYGESEEEIFKYLKNSKEELNTLLTMSANQDEIILQLEKDKEDLLAVADKLSIARKHTASEFEVRVKHELTFLDMPNVEIQTAFERCKLNSAGSDIIEFLISPNPGESLKPLAKIASGGELSRIMLAIQNVLAKTKNNVSTMIFDEIDTGISGGAAEKIAISLQNVSKTRQVICITHSAQVAAYADHHFLITKEVLNGKTYTRVTPLDKSGRIEEVARIIGGVNVTDLQISNAKEMLENAKIAKIVKEN
ncbi:MAG: DNA repair protein RecN [Ruminococcaceae bacterium]|nr:DNA repair protein RecN [Oscillospiraceae bacterium]